MKTVEFEYTGCESLANKQRVFRYKTYSDDAPSGTYVLASEANEQDNWNVKKRKELELEQIKDKGRIKTLEAEKPLLKEHYKLLIEGYTETINELESKLNSANERIQVLEDALNKIAYPIRYLQSNLKEGEQLNEVMALELADNSSWLKEIARAALEVKP